MRTRQNFDALKINRVKVKVTTNKRCRRIVNVKSDGRLRTGSTGRTIATGVKGLDEGSIRNASIDREQLAQRIGI